MAVAQSGEPAGIRGGPFALAEICPGLAAVPWGRMAPRVILFREQMSQRDASCTKGRVLSPKYRFQFSCFGRFDRRAFHGQRLPRVLRTTARVFQDGPEQLTHWNTMTGTPSDRPRISKLAAALVQDLMAAEAGAQIWYGSTDQGLRRELRELAWEIYQGGQVLLVQKRNAKNGFDYVMIRTAKPFGEPLLPVAAEGHRA